MFLTPQELDFSRHFLVWKGPKVRTQSSCSWAAWSILIFSVLLMFIDRLNNQTRSLSLATNQRSSCRTNWLGNRGRGFRKWFWLGHTGLRKPLFNLIAILCDCCAHYQGRTNKSNSTIIVATFQMGNWKEGHKTNPRNSLLPIHPNH